MEILPVIDPSMKKPQEIFGFPWGWPPRARLGAGQGFFCGPGGLSARPNSKICNHLVKKFNRPVPPRTIGPFILQRYLLTSLFGRGEQALVSLPSKEIELNKGPRQFPSPPAPLPEGERSTGPSPRGRGEHRPLSQRERGANPAPSLWERGANADAAWGYSNRWSRRSAVGLIKLQGFLPMFI